MQKVTGFTRYSPIWDNAHYGELQMLQYGTKWRHYGITLLSHFFENGKLSPLYRLNFNFLRICISTISNSRMRLRRSLVLNLGCRLQYLFLTICLKWRCIRALYHDPITCCIMILLHVAAHLLERFSFKG